MILKGLLLYMNYLANSIQGAPALLIIQLNFLNSFLVIFLNVDTYLKLVESVANFSYLYGLTKTFKKYRVTLVVSIRGLLQQITVQFTIPNEPQKTCKIYSLHS